nr:MAG TPA: hypothetical protein [Caudoviricetes sp.]
MSIFKRTATFSLILIFIYNIYHKQVNLSSIFLKKSF